MSGVRAVFFDSGHTLVRPLGGRWFPGVSFFETCRAHGLEVRDDAALESAMARGYAYLAEHHDRVPDVAAEQRQLERYYEILLQSLGLGPTRDLTAALARAMVDELNFEPCPGARALLDALRARGMPMAVITDAWPSIRTKYDAVGWLDYFDALVISAEVGCTKPDLGMFTPALDRLSLEPAEVLFLDDAPAIVAGARAHGFRARLVDLEGAHPGHERVTALGDVLDLIG